ncbi:MAG: hypothetical protein HYY17_03025 [Planctomycetes bacterium]|nr:hypothetical protein [Planctomycetota bacterium]
MAKILIPVRWILYGAMFLLIGTDRPCGLAVASGGRTKAQEGWTSVESPCSGSKTSAFWFDDRKTGYMGIGETQEGAGLFRTKDGGRTWEATPAFADVRVNDVRRGPDGRLYGAGWHRGEGYSAWVFDEKAGECKPVGLFKPGKNAWTSVAQGENIAVTKDGQILVDSLTGVTAAYKPAGGEFVEFRSLVEAAIANPEARGFQVRRVVAFENRFYACGSVINEPAQVFLPSKDPRATYHTVRLEIQPSRKDGELLDMHVWSADHAIVAGWDQSDRVLMAYVGRGDLYNKESWQRVDFKASGIDFKGGIAALSVVGDNVAAVGGKFPSAKGGFVLRSADGGKTWKDVTPKSSEEGKVDVFSNVWLFQNGDMAVAGGGGELWLYEAKK